MNERVFFLKYRIPYVLFYLKFDSYYFKCAKSRIRRLSGVINSVWLLIQAKTKDAVNGTCVDLFSLLNSAAKHYQHRSRPCGASAMTIALVGSPLIQAVCQFEGIILEKLLQHNASPEQNASALLC